MHVLAGINYNHQAPDTAAKLVRRFFLFDTQGRADATRVGTLHVREPPGDPRPRQAGTQSPIRSHEEPTHVLHHRRHGCPGPHRPAQRTRRREAFAQGRPPLSTPGPAGVPRKSADPQGLRTFRFSTPAATSQTTMTNIARRPKQILAPHNEVTDRGEDPFLNQQELPQSSLDNGLVQ